MAYKAKHYSPQLQRFLVTRLYFAAKSRNVPMTKLANSIIEAGLNQMEGIKATEEPPNYG